MKKAILILLIGISAMAVLSPVFSSPDYTYVKQPDDTQQCTLLGLEREIGYVQKEIQEYYAELLDNPCAIEEGGNPTNLNCGYYRIHPKTQMLIIPLLSEKQSFYGLKARYFRHETGFIQWDGKKVKSFRFEQRRSQLGRGYSISKTLTVDANVLEGVGYRMNEKSYSIDFDQCLKMKPAERKPGKAVNFFVKEYLVSGRGGLINFKFPTKNTIRDGVETQTINGQPERVSIVYVRSPQQKIQIVREYLRYLRLTLRRIDWNARAAKERKAAEINRILNNEY